MSLTRVIGSIAVVALWVVGAPAMHQASAARHPGTSVRCTWRTVVTDRWFSVQGTRAGTLSCRAPLGAGRFTARYSDHVDPPTASETATPQLVFPTGVLHGSSHVSGVFQAQHYRGVFRVTGGTGRFSHAAGTLQLRCTIRTTDETCHASGTLRGA